MNTIELIAAISGGVCIYLAAKESLWNWFFGIITVTLSFYIFYQTKLYGDMALQVVYLVLNIYGWYVWVSKRGERKVKPTVKINTSLAVILSIIGFVFWITMYYYLDTYTDASYPWADSLATAISIVAQYMMSKKILENWILWFAANLIYVPLLYYKNLFFLSALYLLLLGNAIYGYYAWRRNYYEGTAQVQGR